MKINENDSNEWVSEWDGKKVGSLVENYNFNKYRNFLSTPEREKKYPQQKKAKKNQKKSKKKKEKKKLREKQTEKKWKKLLNVIIYDETNSKPQNDY